MAKFAVAVGLLLGLLAGGYGLLKVYENGYAQGHEAGKSAVSAQTLLSEGDHTQVNRLCKTWWFGMDVRQRKIKDVR
jgi:hypothetical protein